MPGGVKILHINIGNLKRKIEDIKDDDVKNSHMISVNETHLGHSDIPTPGMMGISKDVLIVHCDHNNKGGGVALIVNKNLNPKQIRMNTMLEIVAVKISEPIQMIVVSVYRPPSVPIDVFMNHIVMYGSAVLFLGLPRDIGSHKYYRGAPQYTMLIFRFSSLHTLRQNIKRHNYCIQCICLFIVNIYFYYYNTMHRYIKTHLSV